jgi:hypothetical protein
VNRLVVGSYEGIEAGYIGDARRYGGIYYDPGPAAWNALGHGLSDERANELGWQVNEAFLRTQIERVPARIDYVLDRGQFSSLDEVLALTPHSSNAKQIAFLENHAKVHGYQRHGSSWVQVGVKGR